MAAKIFIIIGILLLADAALILMWCMVTTKRSPQEQTFLDEEQAAYLGEYMERKQNA